MKKLFFYFIAVFFFFIAAFLSAACSQAVSPEQILDRVGEVFKLSKTEGLSFTMEMEGEGIKGSAELYELGDKEKSVFKDDSGKVDSIEWSDKTTTWSYRVGSNTIWIYDNDEEEQSSIDSQLTLLDSVKDYYSFSQVQEKDDSWELNITRLETADSELPKSMKFIVSKKTGLPIYWEMIAEDNSSVIMRNFARGVSEAQVTFNPDDYPGVSIY